MFIVNDTVVGGSSVLLSLHSGYSFTLTMIGYTWQNVLFNEKNKNKTKKINENG